MPSISFGILFFVISSKGIRRKEPASAHITVTSLRVTPRSAPKLVTEPVLPSHLK
ncbi:hypothetical protein ACSBR2_017644 [Camellia fascicularis]